MALLVLLIGGVNAALDGFVLRAIEDIRERIVKMERGHWRGTAERTSEDELGRLVRSFQVLGLEIDALVSHLLLAERLSVLALLSRHLEGQLEPEVRRVGQIGAQLHEHDEEAGEALTRTAASRLTTLRSLDRAFSPGFQTRPSEVPMPSQRALESTSAGRHGR